MKIQANIVVLGSFVIQTIWREWEFGSVQNANFTKPGRLGQISQTNWIVGVLDAGKGFERP